MKYAIVETGGKQYKAVEGGKLEVDRLQVETGLSIKLERVLLFSDGDKVIIGTPVIKDTPIWTKVIEHFKGPKVTIFNYRPKKRIRVKTGHRQNYTRLQVEQIGGATLSPKKEHPKVEVVAEETQKAEMIVKKPAISSQKGKVAKAAPSKTKAKKETKSSTKGKAAPAKTSTKKPANVPAKTSSKEKTKPKRTTKVAPAKSSATKKPVNKKTAARKQKE